uniref:Uncharacterized protein LOC117360295 n=1 Tax=Geotrypetes seraphini TaxID=260995 RepID=A0A6P8QN60_GEOSA|nr:uncharacterized protein LOC117360295 [Geotrypetes seraphini]
MGGSILPGPASLFSWSPQMPAFLPGGRDSGVSDVGAARAPERPGGSGSERSSAFGGEVAAGGGATGSSHLSSSLPGVAVRGVSASGPVSSSGNAVRGISSGGVVDPGSSSQGSCGRSYSLWIVGHSFIHWASERAAIRPGGRHLGLSHQGLRVSWWGQRGMRWSHLLLLLERLRSRPRHPDLLLLHLGGNDVDACSGKDLVNIIKDDLRIKNIIVVPRSSPKEMENVASMLQNPEFVVLACTMLEPKSSFKHGMLLVKKVPYMKCFI